MLLQTAVCVRMDSLELSVNEVRLNIAYITKTFILLHDVTMVTLRLYAWCCDTDLGSCHNNSGIVD